MRIKGLIGNKLIQRLIWITMLIIIWELIALGKIFSPLIFPSFTIIIDELYKSILSGEVISNLIFSLILLFQGIGLGIIISLILAGTSILSKTINSFVDTVYTIAHPLPGIALLPLIILFFGTGTSSIIIIIVHSVVWPMMINMITGLKSVPQIYKEVGYSLGVGRIRVLTDIMLPSSFPYILAGIKIGWARGWRALISAEMIFGAVGGIGGIGWFIFKERVFMNTPGIYGSLIIVIFTGIIIDDILKKVEKETIKKWNMTVGN